MVAIGVGLLLFARTPVDGNYLTDLLPPMLLIGVGVGTAFPSLMTLAMSGRRRARPGLASGLVNTSMQVGGAIGLAVLATLATERTDHLLDGGHSNASALNSGYHLAYLVGAVHGWPARSVIVRVAMPLAGAPPPPSEQEGRAPAPPPSRGCLAGTRRASLSHGIEAGREAPM